MLPAIKQQAPAQHPDDPSFCFRRDAHFQRLDPVFKVSVIVQICPAGGTAILAGHAANQVDRHLDPASGRIDRRDPEPVIDEIAERAVEVALRYREGADADLWYDRNAAGCLTTGEMGRGHAAITEPGRARRARPRGGPGYAIPQSRFPDT